MEALKVKPGERTNALFMSTSAFTVCFAVWTIFSVIGIKIKGELGLNETQFGLLTATPILSGSLSRLFLGIWTDQYGGRIVYTVVMILSALATWLLSELSTFIMLLTAGLGLGLAGGSFAVGIAYISRWYPKEKQGTALGIFGVGNVGAAITNFGAPYLLIFMGNEWEYVCKIYAVILFITAIAFWLFTQDDPVLRARKKHNKEAPSTLELMEPLKNVQVWRFSLYYAFVFGAFVALALWLPHYYMGVYDVDLKTAGVLAACYALPGSIFRALGGWLSDKYGARQVMYWTFIVSLICTFFMSYPSTDYIVDGVREDLRFNITLGIVPFVILSMILGFFMSLGKAAVYKHIPVYYPSHVGSVGGVVGLIGGLGGFFLPIIFGAIQDILGIWTGCFMLLFGLVAVSLIWMHHAIRRMEREKHPDLKGPKMLPKGNHE